MIYKDSTAQNKPLYLGAGSGKCGFTTSRIPYYKNPNFIYEIQR
ncbi:hypothetical protein [Peribacillus frigoritolerans]